MKLMFLDLNVRLDNLEHPSTALPDKKVRNELNAAISQILKKNHFKLTEKVNTEISYAAKL